MNNKDLQYIKSKFGEKMMHLCRENFPKILENEGVLSQLLNQYFCHNRNLAEDILEQDKLESFRDFIFAKVNVQEKEVENVPLLSAQELLDEAGYVLYPECLTESDIQSFRHYYYREDGQTPVYDGGRPAMRKGEELCTFNGGRLSVCRIWFAVKKDVDDIKRENFDIPDRQDEYGTSVISIQFTKHKNSVLTIKNRYNHIVSNPDNTFNSNLDNIIEGLSDAFARDYGVRDFTNNRNSSFTLKNYVLASDGKYYPYNYEIDEIYYCPNNIIIDDLKVKRLPSDRQLLVDYFILDTRTKQISLYDKNIKDIFVSYLDGIQKIDFGKDGLIKIKKQDNGNVVLQIDKKNRIVALEDDSLTECDWSDEFMLYSNFLTALNLPLLEQCGSDFMNNNKHIKELNLPRLKKCGHCFMNNNQALKVLNLPSLEECGIGFFHYNNTIEELNLPNLRVCGNHFFGVNNSITQLNLPQLERCGDFFFCQNNLFTDVNVPKLQICGDGFLFKNKSLTKLSLPQLRRCGDVFMFYNKSLEEIYLPYLQYHGENFLPAMKIADKKIATNKKFSFCRTLRRLKSKLKYKLNKLTKNDKKMDLD